MRRLVFFIITFTAGSALSQNNLPTPCEKASPQVKTLIQSAIETFDANEPARSIQTLRKILEPAASEELDGLCKAWAYQWLALSYDDLDSLQTARQYVIRSLAQDPEIWREHADTRLPPRLRKTYQDCWNAIEKKFSEKRRNWRIAVGPIARAEFSNRFGLATGIGTSVIRIEELNDVRLFQDLKLFQDLLLYVRAQRMRKNIERLTAGFYGEVSLSLKESEKPVQILSFGPILSYAYQSGWELGSTFEIVRFVIGGGKTRISQTISIKDNKLAYSYANFELYIRKWF